MIILQKSSFHLSWERRRPASQSGAENRNSPAGRQRSQVSRSVPSAWMFLHSSFYLHHSLSDVSSFSL
jgi:hypothetical protein